MEGRLGGEDGSGRLQAEKVEKLLDQAEQQATLRRGEELVKARIQRLGVGRRVRVFEHLTGKDEGSSNDKYASLSQIGPEKSREFSGSTRLSLISSKGLRILRIVLGRIRQGKGQKINDNSLSSDD